MSREGEALVFWSGVTLVGGIGLLAALHAAAGYATPDMIKSSAESNAATFANDMGLDINGRSCTSDVDKGYVSCTLAMPDGTTKAIECNHTVMFAPFGQKTGCRLVVFARGGFAPVEE